MLVTDSLVAFNTIRNELSDTIKLAVNIGNPILHKL